MTMRRDQYQRLSRCSFAYAWMVMILGDGLVVTDLRYPGFILTRWEEVDTVVEGAVWKKRVD